MEYNIVTSYRIVQELQKSKYFKVNLGYCATVDMGNGRRTLREDDSFAYFYNTRFNTTILGQGLIANISIYTNHHIITNHLAIYVDKQEFLFDFDYTILREKGIDSYIGSFLKEIEEEIENGKIQKTETISKPLGNANKLNPNSPEYSPGSVNFDDIKAYQAAKLRGEIK